MILIVNKDFCEQVMDVETHDDSVTARVLELEFHTFHH